MSHFKPFLETYIVEAPYMLAYRRYAVAYYLVKLAELPTSQIANRGWLK